MENKKSFAKCFEGSVPIFRPEKWERIPYMNQQKGIVQRSQKAFTLIELAIVLVIMGIMLGAGIGLLGPLIKRAKTTETKETIQKNIEGIIGYTMMTKSIPRLDNDIRSAFYSFRDPYNKKLLYIFDANAATNICSNSINSTNITINRNCSNAACNNPDAERGIKNVAFVLISGSANYNIQTVDSNLSGLDFLSNSTVTTYKVTSPITINIYKPNIEVDDWRNDLDRKEPYDDIVDYILLTQLKTKLSCQANTDKHGYSHRHGGE